MIGLQSLFGDSAHKINARREPLKLEGATNGLCAFIPLGYRFQLKLDLLGGQGCHNGKSILVSTGAALFAAAGEFIDGCPSAGFGDFHTHAFLFVTGFDVCRLTFLFGSITGFVALGHGVCFWL
jgi:hypothetical protein